MLRRVFITSVTHHPDGGLLLDFCRAALSAGKNLVLQAHVELCSACRRKVDVAFALDEPEAVETQYAAVSEDALDAALQRVDDLEASPKQQMRAFLRGLDLPDAVDRDRIGARRHPAPGVWIAPVALNDTARVAKTYLIHVRAGMTMPRHTHRGQEMTQVLSGSLKDGGECCGPGDLIVHDASNEHSPAAVTDCLCLIAADAPVVMTSLIGRLVQPFAGI